MIALRTESIEARSGLEGMQSVAEASEESLKALTEAKENSEKQVVSLLSAKKKCDARRRKLEKELKKVKATLEEAMRDRAEALEYVKGVEEEDQVLQRKVDDLEEALDRGRREMESSSRSHRQTTELVKHLEQENRELNEKVTESAQLLDAERRNRKTEIAKLEGENAQLEQRLVKMEEEGEKAREVEGSEKEEAIRTLTKALNEARVDKAVMDAENKRLREIVQREKQAGLATSDRYVYLIVLIWHPPESCTDGPQGMDMCVCLCSFPPPFFSIALTIFLFSTLLFRTLGNVCCALQLKTKQKFERQCEKRSINSSAGTGEGDERAPGHATDITVA